MEPSVKVPRLVAFKNDTVSSPFMREFSACLGTRLRSGDWHQMWIWEWELVSAITPIKGERRAITDSNGGFYKEWFVKNKWHMGGQTPTLFQICGPVSWARFVTGLKKPFNYIQQLANREKQSKCVVIVKYSFCVSCEQYALQLVWLMCCNVPLHSEISDKINMQTTGLSVTSKSNVAFICKLHAIAH